MKKIFAISLLAIIFITGCTDIDNQQIQSVVEPKGKATQIETQVEKNSLENFLKEEPDYSELSNDNYYINSKGNKVHSPAYAPSIPAGASAKCRDGTYSFSQSRRGTCSSHGGVAEWY